MVMCRLACPLIVREKLYQFLFHLFDRWPLDCHFRMVGLRFPSWDFRLLCDHHLAFMPDVLLLCTYDCQQMALHLLYSRQRNGWASHPREKRDSSECIVVILFIVSYGIVSLANRLCEEKDFLRKVLRLDAFSVPAIY